LRREESEVKYQRGRIVKMGLIDKIRGEVEAEFAEGRDEVMVTQLSKQAVVLLEACYALNKRKVVPVISPRGTAEPNTQEQVDKFYNLIIYRRTD